MGTPNRDLVRRARVFADLTNEECDAVAGVFKPLRVAAGATLFKEGEAGNALMLVVSGSLTVSVKTPSGNDETVRTVRAGDVIGEIAFFDSKPRSATLVACEPCALFAFTRGAMRLLRGESPRVAAAIHRGLLKDVAHRLYELAEKTVDGDMMPMSVPLEASAALRPGGRLQVADFSKFAALTKFATEDREVLVRNSTYRMFAPGDLLMEEGRRGLACWLLLTGEVDVKKQGAPLATLGPGALLGQLALLDGTLRSSTATARTPVSALEIRSPGFSELLGEQTPTALRFQEQVALAGVTQIRLATNRFVEIVSRRTPVATKGNRTMEWDSDGLDDVELELDYSSPPPHR